MNNLAVTSMLLGAIAAACFAIGLYFVKFWRSSRDRFYLLFAASFLLEAVNRAVIGFVGYGEHDGLHYLVRILAYSLIVVAIWGKNRR